ncbi:site-specific integrase [Pseudomonas sp. BN411]|uniref:site-specific integrase n=1 Tax=Pseudomonas sp. BN411 TaxID=2567887 RepID=UPI0024544CAA|nr:site-specific integrase [Pseudomonas sp. BN411]MDH4564252.1 site-specific integrase [Pseudomonas sp. BN411]
MHDLEPIATARYHKVPLTNVKLWEPCSPDEAVDWPECFEAEDADFEPYPVKPIPYQESSAPLLYVIIHPDGGIWLEGSLYLFERITELGTKATTASNIAGDLSNFMNTLLTGCRDFLDFDGPSFQRPTYYYKSELKKLLIKRELKRSTANRKILSMVGFYRWLCATRNFKPKQEMWKDKVRNVRYLDRHGIQQSKEIRGTDLTFRSAESISTGQYISDGGKLSPISRENQKHLLATLVALGNPEMILIHIVALTTGMRIQSILTLRHACIKQGKGGPNDPSKYALYGIKIGEGTLVEAKRGKPQTVLMPAWVHYKLSIYLNSERHKERAMRSAIKNEDDQYLFLTRTGRPYYTAEADQEAFDYSSEKGSAIRQYLKTIGEKLNEMGANFRYQFHDLRATFGMNLIEDNMKHVENGKMNQLELLDLLKNRLNQEDINTALGYLKYREGNELVAYAQSDFEDHLQSVITTEMLRHENIRTKLLSS